MLKIVNENRLFFVILAIYSLACTFLLINFDQGTGILYFSERRSPFGDAFFWFATTLGEEWVYVVFVILMAFVRFRLSILIPVVGFTVMIVSALSKAIFSHDRPLTYFNKLDVSDQLNLIEGLEMFTGATSFPSGHTMSAFAMYSFVAFSLKDKTFSAIILGMIAVLVGVSRVYLVQHFIKDILLGALMGVFLAMIIHLIHTKWPYKPDTRSIDRSILKAKAVKQA